MGHAAPSSRPDPNMDTLDQLYDWMRKSHKLRDTWYEVDKRGRMTRNVGETAAYQEERRQNRIRVIHNSLLKYERRLASTEIIQFRKRKKLKNICGIHRFVLDQLRGDNNQESIDGALKVLKEKFGVNL